DARRLDDIKNHRIDPNSLLPRQEPGTKPACAIPYDARVNATVTNTEEGKALMVRFTLDGKLPKTKTVGMPFIAICRTPYTVRDARWEGCGILRPAGEHLCLIAGRWMNLHQVNTTKKPMVPMVFIGNSRGVPTLRPYRLSM